MNFMGAIVFFFDPTKREFPCNFGGTVLKTGNSGIRASRQALLLLATLAFSTSPGLVLGDDKSLFSGSTTGWNFEQYYLYSSFYTKHYDPEPDHVNHQDMIGFEGQTGDQRVMGLALFDNSFGQESQYLYLGRTWRAFSTDRWHFKLTGGLLNGYDEPHEDKIPLNGLGVAPVLVPTLGFSGKSFAVEFSQLGLAAGIITAGLTF